LPAGRFGIRAGVNQHLISFATALGPNDRAALQGLIPLAGAVGAGTIFSLFAGGRRGTGFRVFEVFAIVAVLTAAGITAALSIDLLHAGHAITNKELTQTAMPLVIATLLLVAISIFERIGESWNRALLILVFAAVAIYVATALVIASSNVDPESAMPVVAGIFAVGLLLAGAGWAIDRYNLRAARRVQQDRVRRLVRLGYVPTRVSLRPALPRVAGEEPQIAAWTKGESTLLDSYDAEWLRDLVRTRWDALAAGNAEGAVGEAVLLDVRLQPWVKPGHGPAKLEATLLRFDTKEPERTVELPSVGDDLYDVSELVG
jgi:hypothetical protein